MKPRIKDILLASVPVLLGGIWGVWMLGRTPMLSSGINRALERLRSRGIGTQVSPVEWTSWGTAHIAQVAGVVGADTVLKVNDISLQVQPAFSLHARDWVEALDFGALQITYKGWEVHGKGRLFPSTMALQLSGGFSKQLNDGSNGVLFAGMPSSDAQDVLPWAQGIASMGGGTDETTIFHPSLPLEQSISGLFQLRMGAQRHVNGRRHFDAGLQITELAMRHDALGHGLKTIRELDAWARVEVFANAYALRPGSCLRVGRTVVLGSARCDLAAHAFEVRMAVPKQPAANLLDVAQAIAPRWLQGMQLSGDAHGFLHIAGDLDSLAQMQLDGDLSGDGITILDGGRLRLDTLEQWVAGNDWVPLATLPQYLVQAVVLSEDANFWTHHGFDKEIIRLAIAENWEAGKFVRGAGTIPMQLMRNIYLHHGKQADRKLAEIALTWIAEETALIDKHTQLELYLNLIEWGPDVYGIEAAAQYYFHKHPAKLTVDEAIFLAAIIPNPRYAAKLLEPDGSLTPYAQEYYDSMRWMLYEGDFIGEEWLEAEYPRFLEVKNARKSDPGAPYASSESNS